MKTLFLLFSLSLLWSGTGKTQSITVEEYRKRVLAYNQELKQARTNVQATRYALKSITTGFLPQVEISGNYSYQLEETEFMQGVNLKHANYQAEAAVTQNVYAGGANKFQRNRATAQTVIALLAEEWTTDNLIYTADITYWNAAANEQLHALSQEFLNIVQALYTIVEKRFREGAVSKTDLLMIQTRLQEAELNRSTARMNHETALQTLKIMMGVPLTEAVFIADSIQHPIPIPSPLPDKQILERRADYRIANEQIHIKRLETKLTQSEYLPRFQVGIKENWGTPLINTNGEERFTTTAFAQLHIPLFHWGKKKHLIQEAYMREQDQILERDRVKDQIQKEWTHARTRLQEIVTQLEIARSTLETAQENLRLNTFSYNEGKLPILDVLSAQATWLQAYTNVVLANHRYKTAIAEYVRSMGGF